MEGILRFFETSTELESLIEGLEKGIEEQMVTGLSGSSRQLLMAALQKKLDQPLMVVTHNVYQARKVYDDLQELYKEAQDKVMLYPANEGALTEWMSVSRDITRQRVRLLDRLLKGQVRVLVVPVSGWRRLLPPRRQWEDKRFSLHVGQRFDIGEVVEKLVFLGYERVGRVEAAGEFSQRGGIIDFFPHHLEMGVRIEWFDEEIDSLRTFDPQTQRSCEGLEAVTVLPVDEWGLTREERRRGAEQVLKFIESYMKKIGDIKHREKVREKLGAEIEKLKEGIAFDGQQKFLSAIYPGFENVYHYMPKNTVVIYDEPSRIIDAAMQMEKEEAETIQMMLEEGNFLPQLKVSFTIQELRRRVRGPLIDLSTFLRKTPYTDPQNLVHFMSKPMQDFHGQLNLLKQEVMRWQENRFHVVFVTATKERSHHLERVLADDGVAADRIDPSTIVLPQRPVITEANINTGFELSTMRLVVVTENEVFTNLKRKRTRTQVLNNAERIKSYQQLNVGDYVVHVNHGIGRYMGIETLHVGGIHKDYLHIKYAGNDKLYVPIDQIDLVQKYVAGEDAEPKIYRLGGSDWHRMKSRVRSSVKDIAADLVKLYAKRQASRGHAFSADTELQREFEALFPYEETPDQLRAIEEIKRDMEKSQPMDRLLCGDVGYGKTEVVIRATFKAVMDGKQVAVLVPTTILAQQHFETFRARFTGFPVKIGVMSRFRTKKQQAETLKGLKNGTVDIVIGTHRLLSKDVQFKDLGLLIIDEEQRFGVTHKEKLKQLKENVDVVTLTATPIPRTLHMSMLGVRDLSVIETPPENRFPVQTYVVEYSDALVREAIERELARSGQVFFLHNYVQDIEKKAEELGRLVPDARIGVAHGQMAERELERTMFEFLEGEFDVLVSTSIIETGVDFPNANTLIVDRSDKMGLAQLYQLRGRVGRSNRIAYAYFTYQPDRILSEVAEKRLEAIKEFTELGSGFKIAMRDLSIRGAGNLLGPEQHGFITSVGFEMYNQMLAEAVKELKEGIQEKEEAPAPQVELNVDAYLPESYISDSSQKIEMYKRVADVKTIQDAEALADECVDRFGEIPEPVARLLSVSRIRAHARTLGVQKIREEGDDWIIEFWPEQTQKLDGSKLFKLASEYPRRVRLISGQKVGVKIHVKDMHDPQRLKLAEEILRRMSSVFKERDVGSNEDVRSENPASSLKKTQLA